jgi:hypothetical protein
MGRWLRNRFDAQLDVLIALLTAWLAVHAPVVVTLSFLGIAAALHIKKTLLPMDES